ncbi:MAG: hypothetical protein WC695_04475 [Candidatus Omnitrophota bacterium]
MRLRSTIILFCLIIICSVFTAKNSFADTVFLTNNTTADGIILSDQPDFIILYNKETYWRMIIEREFIVKIEENDLGTKTKEEKEEEKKNE